MTNENKPLHQLIEENYKIETIDGYRIGIGDSCCLLNYENGQPNFVVQKLTRENIMNNYSDNAIGIFTSMFAGMQWLSENKESLQKLIYGVKTLQSEFLKQLTSEYDEEMLRIQEWLQQRLIKTSIDCALISVKDSKRKLMNVEIMMLENMKIKINNEIIERQNKNKQP